MNYVHDVHDWMGGYPYESIGPAAVRSMMGKLGFRQVSAFARGFSIGLFGSGCDEFVFTHDNRNDI
jgi:2-polyprenyl-6-hydroxyphenyl methylase/3-demethylubiquinone-9 3-methyltransferase